MRHTPDHGRHLTRVAAVAIATAVCLPAAARAADVSPAQPSDRGATHARGPKADQHGHDQTSSRSSHRHRRRPPATAGGGDHGSADAPPVAPTSPAGDGAPGSHEPGPGEHRPVFDHVVSLSSGPGGPLVLARSDGSTVTATVDDHTDVRCSTTNPGGPYAPCAKTRLTPGARVVYARKVPGTTGEAWALVLILGPVPAPAPVPPAAGPPPPTPPAAGSPPAAQPSTPDGTPHRTRVDVHRGD